ncbi:MAG: hypothetical protein U0L74_00195 [Paludibacteraceae bacterium]|nr:hypothetical protein [Paludibacteraceae bacterium]
MKAATADTASEYRNTLGLFNRSSLDLVLTSFNTPCKSQANTTMATTFPRAETKIEIKKI